MSSISEAFAHDDTPRGTLFAFFAHLFPYAIVTAFLFTIYGYFGSPGIPPLAGLITEYISVALCLIGLLHMGFSRLCIRCIRSMPLNMKELAQKRDFWLKSLHLVIGFRSAIYWLIGYGILVLMVRAALIGHYPAWDSRDYAWIGAGIPVFTTWVGWSIWQHHRLRPECPYCRPWDEGGAREPSPDPQIKSTLS